MEKFIDEFIMQRYSCSHWVPQEKKMVPPAQRFQIFILASFLAFGLILWFVTRGRQQRPSLVASTVIAAVVVVGGMNFAVFANNAGWPWWIYYPVPALVTLLLPPLALRMSSREVLPYVTLAFLSSPVIHVLFSLLLDWHEYMPFLRVPSLGVMLGGISELRSLA